MNFSGVSMAEGARPMKRMPILILLGCVNPGSQADPKEAVRAAIGKVREQSSYRVKYKAVMKAPHSDEMVIEGESVWTAPGILYVQYRASGGDEKRIVRVGEKVWIYHEFVEDWVTAEEMGNRGAGRGVQNPEEVLAVLQKHAESVKEDGEEKVGGRPARAYRIEMTGPEIEKIMREQTSQGAFDWKESKASARVRVDAADGLIYRFGSEAELKSADPEMSGTVTYRADVEVQSFGKEASLSFTIRDSQGAEKPLTLSKAVLDEIESLRKTPLPK